MIRKILLEAFILVLLIFGSCYSQITSDTKYITLETDSTYSADWFWRFWFGDHWRDLWTTSVKVEVLDLKNFDGGLIPIKEGGGLQTKSLRFKGNNGLFWKFRSLDKDPSKLLPHEFQNSIAEDILKDQISSSNPFAPLIVSPILNAVGVLESIPRIVFLADDPTLGRFREKFKNQVGTLEIHPNEGDDEDNSFADAEDVKGTYKLLNHLEKNTNEKISAVEFLKARLIDILVGDWDRHMDQWRWAKFRVDNRSLWFPIPRDRDQAFVKYDGILPQIATYILPQLTSFDDEYPSIKSLTWNGRFLDRRVLTELDKKTWDSVTVFVQKQISDSVIENSINRLPPEIYELSAEELRCKLISRRNQLLEISNEFYELTNKVSDIFCSSKNDIVFVSRLNNEETEVKIYKREENSFVSKGELLYNKIFSNSVTDEIRVYLNDGDDVAIVRGKCKESPLIRIIGGKGEDVLIDSSVVSGYFLSVTPFSVSKSKTMFYDSGKATRVTYTGGTYYDKTSYNTPKNTIEKYEPKIVDRGHKFIVFPLFGFNTDYGFVVNLNSVLFSYNFRKNPFDQKHKFDVSYSTRFNKFSLKYNGDFNSFPSYNAGLNLSALATQQYTINYFGYGNETNLNKKLNRNEYYRVNQKLITLHPEMFYSFSNGIKLKFGISFNHSNTNIKSDSLLSGFRYDNYGEGNLDRIGLHTEFEFDFRDNEYFPRLGFYSSTVATCYPGIFNTQKAFTKFNFDIRGYYTLNLKRELTIAARTGGSKIFGMYPYYLGSTLGGSENLRAFNKDRFSGDASFFAQLELRMYLGYLKFIFNNKIGMNIFCETGRVFTHLENSERWHPSYGGGFWVSYLENEIMLSTYIAFSEESTIFSFGFGVAF
jgi:Omp85 superfamily domain